VLCSFVFPCCSFFYVFFVLSLSFVFCGVIRFLWWCPFFRGVVHFSVLSTVRCCSCFPRCSFSFVVLFDFPCHSFFCVVDSSALFVFPCCPFFQCSEGVFRVVRFSVLLVFCGVIRFSVQCGGFPRSSFFRVVRLRRVPVPYVRLLATPLPYVRLFFSRDTTLGTCNFSSRVHGDARALRRC